MARAERRAQAGSPAGKRPARPAARASGASGVSGPSGNLTPPPLELPQTPPGPVRDARSHLVAAHGRPAAGPRVLVVGDAMLDHYWSGAVERISPEAPVPVLKIEGQRSVPGGAANVALNLAALGSQVTLLTLVGRDEAALQLESMLEAQGVFMERVADAAYSTTQKIRCVARRQQLLRADIETRPAAGMLETLARRYAALLRGHDLVVLSDYAKGALAQCQPLVRAAREHGIPVLVDPKGKAWERYCGATLVKPNLAEFRGCAGDFDDPAQFRRLGQALRRRLQLDYLLVTRGEDGMCLFGSAAAEGARAVIEQPAQVREVYDVSGAGDTVLATLAHFMAQGRPVDEAMRWANTAAGIVVGKFGTAAVTLDELQAAMAQQAATPPEHLSQPRTRHADQPL
ncbi:MAG: D-glycero-beta-D-manno-heptose-7-phosphate kinase [Burkholderiales bacterium]|nr:D-glycero-beta-D-manno-heptose-7-phosphate kinase [Burkholderiales bacterium]